MAVIRPIKIDATTGLFIEIDNSADDIVANTLSVQGSMVILNSGGILLNSGTISGAGDISFSNPATRGIVQTSGGTLAASNIVGKDRNNTFITGGAIAFPVITDAVGDVDSFQFPRLAGAPTAVPALNSGGGFAVYDDTNNALYLWNGAAWAALNTPETIVNSYVAVTGINAGIAVALNSSCMVFPATNITESAARVIGFSQHSAGSGVAINVIKAGEVTIVGGTMVPGSRYFLGSATAVITTTPATDANHNIIQLGFAENSTTLSLQIVPLAIRRT